MGQLLGRFCGEKNPSYIHWLYTYFYAKEKLWLESTFLGQLNALDWGPHSVQYFSGLNINQLSECFGDPSRSNSLSALAEWSEKISLRRIFDPWNGVGGGLLLTLHDFTTFWSHGSTDFRGPIVLNWNSPKKNHWGRWAKKKTESGVDECGNACCINSAPLWKRGRSVHVYVIIWWMEEILHQLIGNLYNYV